MLSQNHINIIEESKPSWLQLTNNEQFVGQGQFKGSVIEPYANYWIVKTLNNLNEVSYYAICNRKRIKLNSNHLENVLKKLKIADDSGWRLFDFDIPDTKPLPLPLLKVLASTDSPDAYTSIKMNCFVDINDKGDVVAIEWKEKIVDLPRPADRTSNILPTLAWDNVDYADPSDKKQYAAWRDLMIHGILTKKNEVVINLENKLDLNDPAIAAMLAFLDKSKPLDLNAKPKTLLKPRICYRYAKTGQIIAQCESVKRMAKELTGDMRKLVTQSPLLALYGNPVRIFNTPTEENISYGLIPKINRGLVLSAHDNLNHQKNKIIKIGDIGVLLYRADSVDTPLTGVFKQILLGLDKETAENDYQAFMNYKPSKDHNYKLAVLDLTSKGSVSCMMGTQFSEDYFFEALKRSVNLTATLVSKKPVPILNFIKIGDRNDYHNKLGILQLVKYLVGMTDTIDRQFIRDVRTALERDNNDYMFYMRKHFLKATHNW